MIITTSDGLKILKGQNNIDFLFFDSSRKNYCIDYILNNNIKGIILNDIEYQDNDITFLKDLRDYLKAISISKINCDLNIINQLQQLEFLGISDNKKNVIDFKNFTELQVCGLEFSKRIKDLDSCKKLKELTITNYKSISNNLEAFTCNTNLKKLVLLKPNIINLIGINTFNSLEKLEVYSSKNLVDISNISSLHLCLKELQLEKCTSIQNFEPLGNLVLLKKLILTRCGEIKNIDFINNMVSLDFFSFWETKIMDGDISQCDRIHYVGFKDNNNYNRTMSYYENKS